jgi:hypothetical protein
MRRTAMRRRLVVVASCLVLACGATEQGARVDRTTTKSDTPTATTTDATSASTISEVDAEADMDLVEPALLDLSRRLRVPEVEIEVLEVEEVTWPDGSLGCPQPDQMYTQALVEGHRIILGHGGRVYLYHSGGDVPPFLCESDEIDGGYDFIPPPGFDEK